MAAVPERPWEDAFSESYQEARRKFLKAVEALPSFQLFSYPIAEGSEYCIDVAYHKANPAPEEGGPLFVHISGTHGVEGYAGSAVQIQQLRALDKDAPFPDGVSVVVVHALNPHGMAHYRRFNENNVDLNRNGLYDEAAFKELLARESNFVGYEDFNGLFNPPRAPNAFDGVSVFLNAAYYIGRYGNVNMKRSLVTGQYHRPEGIFFGGKELQPSYRLLRKFFEETGLVRATGIVQAIDVHTGLGPQGVDTLLHEDTEGLHRFPIDPATDPQSRAEAMGDAAGQAASGYEHARGSMKEAIPTLFPKAASMSVVTQEFGTLATVLVARALILENMGWHYDRANEAYWTGYTKDAFYVRTPAWRAAILRRGAVLFDQAVAGVAADATK